MRVGGVMRAMIGGMGVLVCVVVGGCSGAPQREEKAKEAREEMTREQAYKQLAQMERQMQEREPKADLKASDFLWQSLQKEKLVTQKPANVQPIQPPSGTASASTNVTPGVWTPVSNGANTQPAGNTSAGQDIAKKLASNAAATNVQPTPIGSDEEFTELIRKAGFEPHANEKGYLPYFDAFPNDESAAGLPGNLRIVYVLSDDKRTLVFLGLVRPFRQEELPKADFQHPEQMDSDAALDPQLIAKLQSANPASGSSRFSGRRLPSGMLMLPVNGGEQALNMEAWIVLETYFANATPGPATVNAAVAEMMMVLRPTQGLWK
jgi:hypothetical protein